MYNNDILRVILDQDGDEKDIDWASRSVGLVLLNAKPIMSKTDYDLAENILMGKFPDARLDRIFTGATMRTLKEKLSKDSTVYFFERIRNALIDERNQAELTITVNSLDPLKETKKKNDKELLKNRKGIEGLMNEITGNNGMPPIKVEGDDYSGNVDDFDEQGGDEFDATDVDTFFSMAWGLKDEWAYQNVINNVFKENEVISNYDKYLNKILISLHNCSQVYVDEIEGSIKIKPLYPWQIEVLHATGSNDFKDADGFNLPNMQTNIRGFMRKFGSHFDFENDWPQLLTAATGTGNSSGGYSGITTRTVTDESQIIYGNSSGQTIDFHRLIEMPISYRYTEWKTITKVEKQKVVTKEGNIISQKVSAANARLDGAPTEIKYHEDTYYAYSLETGNTLNPKVIKWGKVYMQNFDGAQDEYSGFTIKVNKRDGVPVVDIMKPFWNMINVTFKMLEMLVNDIKPDGLNINYSSMLSVAEYLKSNSKDLPDDVKSGVDLFLEMVQESPNLITDTPKGEEGEVLGGGSSGVSVRKNGLNATAVDCMKVIDWCEAKVNLYLGTQGIELIPPEDGFKVSIENRKRTRAATSFIDFIMLSHLKDISITVMNYAQDITGFKDIPAYKYLEYSVGYKVMEYIASKEKSPHRYGTFIETFNNDIQLMEIRGRAGQALDQKEITLEQYMVLMSLKNPVQVAMQLAYDRKKAEKKKQEEVMAAMKGQDALAEAAFQRQLQLEDKKGEWQRMARQSEAQGFISAANLNSSARITTEQMKQDGQNNRVASEGQNKLDEINQKANSEAQKPLI